MNHPSSGAHANVPHIHVREDDFTKGVYNEAVVLIEK